VAIVKKNKPKQTQFKAKTNPFFVPKTPIKAKTNPIQTQSQAGYAIQNLPAIALAKADSKRTKNLAYSQIAAIIIEFIDYEP
jgi:hypothetical protein